MLDAPQHRDLLGQFVAVRDRTVELAQPLALDDQLAQSMPDVSPTKWHLAHTTWFFERMVLAELIAGYTPVDARYDALFNSYYDAVGVRVPRERRALTTRPTLAEIHAYREIVDARLAQALPKLDPRGRAVVVLGLHHEQQHQELLLTDAKHVLGTQPLQPAYSTDAGESPPQPSDAARELVFVPHRGELVDIGDRGGESFAFDNERPRHRVWLEPFGLASRCVTNAEWLAFIEDGGYGRSELWLSDGWAVVQQERWRAPLYWNLEAREPTQYTLRGVQLLVPDEPVCHVSYYEADAYARWASTTIAGARLPSEAEWEVLATNVAVDGNFAERGVLHPRATQTSGLSQLFGDVWEWTASPYVPYPRFVPFAGLAAEYNGKFMCNQLVLRGGSCLSPRTHLRATYRNFFGPAARWQMTGVRLARSL